jgi:hypothetical protein
MKRQDSKIVSKAMKILRAIPSEKRTAASRANGKKNPARKLSPQDPDRIRDSYEQGMTGAQLAEWFGVNVSLIYRILNRPPSLVGKGGKKAGK